MGVLGRLNNFQVYLLMVRHTNMMYYILKILQLKYKYDWCCCRMLKCLK
jgi:hypothetical protein